MRQNANVPTWDLMGGHTFPIRLFFLEIVRMGWYLSGILISSIFCQSLVTSVCIFKDNLVKTVSSFLFLIELLQYLVGKIHSVQLSCCNFTTNDSTLGLLYQYLNHQFTNSVILGENIFMKPKRKTVDDHTRINHVGTFWTGTK